MNKGSLVVLFLAGLGAGAHAQSNIGMATGNYGGIMGASFNPASIVDSRYKFDMTVFDYGTFFTNKFLEVKDGTLVRRLLYKEPYESSFAAVKDDLLFPVESVDGRVYATAFNSVQFPLSFMASLGPKAAIGLNMRNRQGMTLNNMDPNTARMLFAELGDESLFGVAMDNGGMDYSFLNWSEVGFTYGRVLADGKHHFLKGAVTPKLLACNAAGFIAADELTVSFSDAQHLSMSSPLIRYGRSERADFGTFNRTDIFNNVEDYAFGYDLGFVYELRGKVSKRTFTDFDAVQKERRDLNKYIVRVGVALLDAGKFTVDRRPLTQDHSVEVTDWDISEVNASGLNDFDEAYSELVTYVPDGSPTFTHGLPTSISANVDVHLLGGFYLGAATYRDARELFGDLDARMRVQKWTAITPRFESRFLGFYLPVTWTGRGAQLGASVRIGPFYAGSTNLAQLIANETNTSADLHFGMRFSIGHGKPSALKKKYEAYRKAQEGISSNKSRLDSLEREMYALKMVVDDRSGGRTVINNFFGNDSTAAAMMKDSTVVQAMTGGSAQDREKARLKAENEYLMTELARTSMQQRSDSAYIAKLENADGKDKERVKADREASKMAAKQADATGDMAKELESIDKRMKRQNTILLAGGTAGVVAATSNKKEKPAAVPDSMVAINDSTVVIGTDTVRLVPAPGTPRYSATGDTAFVTVYDTVRVAVQDTVHITERDTLRVENTTVPSPATGLSAADEAEMRRLMEPVYFATGSTTLGPQGRVKVEEIATWLKKNPQTRVTITGFADASGPVSTNETVAQKRAESVRDELVKKGVDTARLTTGRQLAPAGAAPSAKDRRAEVRFDQ